MKIINIGVYLQNENKKQGIDKNTEKDARYFLIEHDELQEAIRKVDSAT